MRIVEKVVDFLFEEIRALQSFIASHFLEFYMAGLFATGALMLMKWGSNPAVSDWIQKGAVVGAILGFLNKKAPPGGGA